MRRSILVGITRVVGLMVLGLCVLCSLPATARADDGCANLGVKWVQGDMIPMGLYDCATGKLYIDIDLSGATLSYSPGAFLCPVIYVQVPAHNESDYRKGWELTYAEDLRVWAYEVECIRDYILLIFPFGWECRLGKKHGHGWIDHWHAQPCAG